MQNNGTIGAFTLILHGTVQIPDYRRNGPRIYNEDYNRIRKTVSGTVSHGRLLYFDKLIVSLVLSLFQYDVIEPIATNEYDGQNMQSYAIDILNEHWLQKLLKL